MTYYIGAFFVGLGVILIGLAVLFVVWVAAEALLRFVNAKFDLGLNITDLVMIPFCVFTCHVIGTSILSHFR